MNDLRLFKMYRWFQELRERSYQGRVVAGPRYKCGTNARMGIAVDDDAHAVRWQKWDGLALLTAKELERRLQ